MGLLKRGSAWGCALILLAAVAWPAEAPVVVARTVTASGVFFLPLVRAQVRLVGSDRQRVTNTEVIRTRRLGAAVVWDMPVPEGWRIVSGSLRVNGRARPDPLVVGGCYRITISPPLFGTVRVDDALELSP